MYDLRKEKKYEATERDQGLSGLCVILSIEEMLNVMIQMKEGINPHINPMYLLSCYPGSDVEKSEGGGFRLHKSKFTERGYYLPQYYLIFFLDYHHLQYYPVRKYCFG